MGDRGFDQRKSYRCPVDQTHAAAELTVGRRRVPICLYNESSGGFAAVADSDPGVSLGDVVGLRTSNGTCEVRVAHVSRVEPPPGEQPSAPAQFRLGLERQHDLASLSDLHSPACRATRRRGFRLFPATTVGTLAIVLLLAAVAMNGLTMWCSAQMPSGFAASGVLPAPSARPPRDEPALPEVDVEAGLTAAQRARVRETAAAAAGVLREIDAQWQHDPPAERARKQHALLDAVQREILRSLPAEQRARGQQLRDE